MITLLGTEVDSTIRGVVYFCYYDHGKKEIGVVSEALYESPSHALDRFANTPNPESQLATGSTTEELEADLEKLHIDMGDPEWLKHLGETL